MEQEILFNVKGKVVVVTGGGRGIGEYIAEGFVTNGAKVYITGRKRNALDETCKKLNDLGKGTCHGISGDLANLQDLQRIIKELQDKEKTIHVLVNNAGGKFPFTLSENLLYTTPWLVIVLCCFLTYIKLTGGRIWTPSPPNPMTGLWILISKPFCS